MPCCSAFGCANRSDRKNQQSSSSKRLTFHRFPKDHDRCQKWTVNLRRKYFKPNRNSVICSEHFQGSCFDRTGQTVRLRPNAEPTIFQFPEHLNKRNKKRNILADRESNMNKEAISVPSNSENMEQLATHEKKIRKIVLNEHAYSLSELPHKIWRKEYDPDVKIEI